MAREEIERIVIRQVDLVVNCGCQIHDIDIDSNLEDLGIDEIDRIEILLALEKEFHIVLEDDTSKN